MTFLKPILIPRIRDDAGAEHEVFDPQGPDQDPAVVDLSLRILEEHGRPKGWNARMSSVEMLPMLLTMVGLAVAQGTGLLSGLGSLSAPLAVASGQLAGRWLTRRATHAQCADLTRTTLLASGRCPACAYAIGDLEPDPGGLIRCPECRAAWKAERLGPVSKPPPGLGASSPLTSWSLMPTVTDRAGTLRRLADPAAAAARRPELAALADRVRRATCAARWAGFAACLLLPFVLVGIPIFMHWGFTAAPLWAAGGPVPGPGIIAPSPGSWDALLAMIAFAILMVFAVRLAWRELRGYGTFSASKTRSTVLGAGRCPACLDPLYDPAAFGEEITPRCQGCGGVWSLTDVEPSRYP